MITVYHRTRTGTLVKVAEVMFTKNLEHAWQQTNHIDRPWWENEDVRPILRSSMVGDIFHVAETNEVFEVDAVGFKKFADSSLDAALSMMFSRLGVPKAKRIMPDNVVDRIELLGALEAVYQAIKRDDSE